MYKKSIKRFKEIVRVLSLYGFGYIIDSKIIKEHNSSVNLRKAFEQLGPTFIKIGQIMSTRPDILPQEYIDELSKLQDNALPEKFEDIDSVFFNEFNKHIEDCFKYFEKKPLASASIAQVHTAILSTGEEVIVKIQRPNIKEKIQLDLSILHKIIRLTKSKLADILIDPEEALNEIFLSTERELDFKIEASNIKKFKELNKNVAFSYTPYIIDNLCNSSVLTMEKIRGFKVTDMERLQEEGYDVNDLGKKLALSFFKQVFTDGFFHADPHPGNLLIFEGKICFIDFGIVGGISDSLKNSLNEAMIAIAFKDLDKLVSIIMSIGIKKGPVDKNKLYADIDRLFLSYLYTSLKNIQISVLLQEVFNCAKNNNIKFPTDLTLLIRSFIIVEGVITKISPDIKILDVAIPFVKNNSKLTLIKNIDFYDVLIYLYKTTKDLSSFPTKLTELLNNVLSGRSKIQLQLPSVERAIRELNKITNRLIFALLTCSLIIGSCLIIALNNGPKIHNMSIIGISMFAASIFMIFILLISIIKSTKL
jgi:ubiquinone biosynthesis protein